MKTTALAPSQHPDAEARLDFVDALNPLELHNRAPWNNVLCGMLVFFSRDVTTLSLVADWNLFWTGLGIAVVALVSMIAHGNVRRNYWSGLNVAAGIWLIVSTRIFASTASIAWALTCLGIVTIGIALTSLANERPESVRAA